MAVLCFYLNKFIQKDSSTGRNIWAKLFILNLVDIYNGIYDLYMDAHDYLMKIFDDLTPIIDDELNNIGKRPEFITPQFPFNLIAPKDLDEVEKRMDERLSVIGRGITPKILFSETGIPLPLTDELEGPEAEVNGKEDE